MKRFHRNESGSIVLEAALILPFFLIFIFVMLSFLKVAVADVALSAALSESTKQVATHMYPVHLLVQEFEQSSTGQTLLTFIEDAKNTRNDVIGAEKFVEHYADYIPNQIIIAVQREKELRQHVEATTIEHYNTLLNAAFTPLLHAFADESILKETNGTLKVTKVVFPNLLQSDSVFFGMEAEYDVKLPIPFFHKTIKLKKSSYERVWIGG